MNKNLKKIFLVESLSLILIVAVVFIVSCVPRLHYAYQLIAQTKKQFLADKITPQQSLAKQRFIFKSRVDEMISQRDQIMAKTERISAKIPADKNIPQVALIIEDMASAAGIELNSIRPQEGQTKDPYDIVSIQLKFRSEYVQIIQFLSKIQESGVLLLLADLVIYNEEKTYPQLDVALTLDVLFQSNKQKSEQK